MSQLLDILRDHKSLLSESMEGISGEKEMIVNSIHAKILAECVSRTTKMFKTALSFLVNIYRCDLKTRLGSVMMHRNTDVEQIEICLCLGQISLAVSSGSACGGRNGGGRWRPVVLTTPTP